MTNHRYVRRLEWAYASHLTDARIYPQAGWAQVPDDVPWHELPLVGMARLTASDAYENGLRSCAVELRARLSCSWRPPVEQLALCATLTDGTLCLVGGPLPPHPLILPEDQHPDRVGDACQTELKITWTAEAPPCTLMED